MTTTSGQAGAERDWASLFQEGLAEHRRGRVEAALALYRRAIARDPSRADAYVNSGIALNQLGDAQAAVALIEQGVALAPANPVLRLNLGTALVAIGEKRRAVLAFDAAAAMDPGMLPAALAAAKLLLELGEPAGALQRHDRVLVRAPDNAEALAGRAAALEAMGEHEVALAAYAVLAAARPGDAGPLLAQGQILAGMRRLDEALARFDTAISLAPDDAAAHANRAGALKELGRLDAALASADRALALAPDNAAAHANRAGVLLELGQPEAALAAIDLAMKHGQWSAMAHFIHGNALQALDRFAEAVLSYERAVTADPSLVDAWNNRGTALQRLSMLEPALACYAQAIALNPAHAGAQLNRAEVLNLLKRMEEARDAYGEALALDPNLPFGREQQLHVMMHLADWDGLPRRLAELAAAVDDGVVFSPFTLLGLYDDPQLLKRNAAAWCAREFPDRMVQPPIPAWPAGERIRIGYFSADFHVHATMALIGDMLACHDRSRFEISAFSFGPDFHDHERQRVIDHCDRFIEVDAMPDTEVAALARSLQIDIAVDLKGWTRGFRGRIFAARPAPVSLAYIGFPGTSGAPFIDYVVADHALVPPGFEDDYSEKIIALPDSYQANCRLGTAPPGPALRAAHGLTDDAVVFCCFNQPYKILPELFDAWMRILAAVDDSQLWLWADEASPRRAMQQRAAAAGIDPARLVFARSLPRAEHLARLPLADLFLDTLPYAAHTTGSDALRMGLPVLTLAGRSFAGRVGASLLAAVGLPEMVTDSRAAYVAKAIALGSDRAALAALRQRLAMQLPHCALFDPERFTRNLERAYAEVFARSQAGLPPAHIRL